MTNLSEKLKIKIFADGADKKTMLEMYNTSFIQGLTTNPTLMRAAGIKNYKSFCEDILKSITDKPVSLEVFADDFQEIERQAREISSWADNVYVKIPITNTKSQPSYHLIKKLSSDGIKLNITAIMTIKQVKETVQALSNDVPSYISVFAGRIADTGVDPVPIMKEALSLMKSNPLSELIWASPREVLNIVQAEEMNCHIITVTSGILKKLNLLGYSLQDFSLDTVKMFYKDAKDAGYNL